MDPADEKQALQEELGALEAEMKAIRERLDSMEKDV
jgi:predicted nuclease with TOPRIM domain